MQYKRMQKTMGTLKMEIKCLINISKIT